MSSPRTPQSPQVLQFRFTHVLRILHLYYGLPGTFKGALPPQPAVTAPLDEVVASHYRRNKMLGSKDRAFISDATYEFFRWRSLLEAIEPERTLTGLLKALINLRMDLILAKDPKYMAQFKDLPGDVKVSCPPHVFRLLVEAYGEERARDLCLALNTQAPITVRTNLVKTTRDQLCEALLQKAKTNPKLQVTKTAVSPYGLHFPSRFAAMDLNEFHTGLFEPQDEASQLAADMVELKKGQRVLDYCAGSGGKSLAFAHKLQGTGQMYLHDVRIQALKRAKGRFSKSGATNVQFLLANNPSLDLLKGNMDWVVADVPCSGSGAFRRNPDQKWRITESHFENLVQQQREIFKSALEYLRPRGKIVYMTCSILPDENERQVERFLKEHSLEVDGEVFKSLPSIGGMDGFFAARMVRKS